MKEWKEGIKVERDGEEEGGEEERRKKEIEEGSGSVLVITLRGMG